LAASWLLQPGWLLGWLNVRGKTQATYKTPTIWGLAYELAPGWWPLLGVLGAAVVAAGLGWLVLRYGELDEAQVVSLALCGSLFITPYAWAYEHALLLLPLVLIFVGVETRWLAWLAWALLILLLPWFLYWVAILLDRDTISFLVPLLVGGAFYGLVCRRSLRTSPFLYRNLGEIGSKAS
jgi:hypothetical protein